MSVKKLSNVLTIILMMLIVSINSIEVKALGYLEHGEIINIIEEELDLDNLLSVNISHSISSRFIKQNREFTVESIITNDSDYDLENIEVKICINGNEEIYSNNIDLIEAKSSKRISFKTAINNRGLYDITSKVNVNINENIIEFKSKDMNISVYNDRSMVKAVINTNNSVNGFISMLEDNNIEVEINTEEISQDVLDGASILVLTEWKNKVYSSEELSSICDFVNNGGNVIITSNAGSSADLEESQENSVLEAIGANIRFNNDKVVDDEINDGEINNLLFSKYNIESSLLEGIDIEKKFGFYNGSSLSILQDSNVETLIRGNDTTYSVINENEDNIILVEKGEVIAVATETLQSGAVIIASGTDFFADINFQNKVYSNYDITRKIVNTLATENEIEVLDISEVRTDSNEDNIVDLYGETVVVEGYVTVEPGIFRNIIYIQDETGGIAIRGINNISVKNGQKISVKGIVSTEQNNVELLVYNDVDHVEILEEHITNIEPRSLSIKGSNNKINKGLLVKIRATVKEVNGEKIFITDESGEGIVFLNNYIGLVHDVVKLNEEYSFIGITESDNEGSYVRIIKSNDIEKINDNETGDEDNSIEVNPEEEDEIKEESEETDINKNNNNNNEKQENIENSEEKLPMTGDVASLGCLIILLIIVGGNVFALFKKYGEN